MKDSSIQKSTYLSANFKSGLSQFDLRPEGRPQSKPWTLMEEFLFTSWEYSQSSR